MTTEIVVGQWWIQNRSKRSWRVMGFAGSQLVRLRSRSGSLTMVARDVLRREYACATALGETAKRSTPVCAPRFARIRKALTFMRDHGMPTSAGMALEALVDLDTLERGTP